MHERARERIGKTTRKDAVRHPLHARLRGWLSAQEARVRRDADVPQYWVYLYHGTSSLFLDDIFARGLLPGKARENKWNRGWAARPELVYLTNYCAAHYAMYSAAGMNAEDAAK